MTTTVSSEGGRPPLDPPNSRDGHDPDRPLSKIIELVSAHEVRSSGRAVRTAAADGVQVTQGTLSRDLVEVARCGCAAPEATWSMRFRRRRRSQPTSGEQINFAARLARVCTRCWSSAEARANLVVLRTPPGAAQYLASSVDHVEASDVLGTIAGDDTCC